MSLKAQLDDPRSPLRGFFLAHLSNTSGMRSLFKGAFVGALSVAPPKTKPYPSGEVGSAFGVRFALAFAPTTAGPAKPRQVGELRQQCIGDFVERLRALLERVEPEARVPAPADEELLCRFCYVLGVFDQVFRIGPRPELPIIQLPSTATADDLLALASAECIGDLCALVAAAQSTFQSLPRSSVVIGPAFAGSRDVGGADADLILDGCLVEVKTTTGSATAGDTLHQVVAYALLDYENKYGIEEVAIYSARQGALARKPLSQALHALAGRPVDVAKVRADLADWLQGDWPRTPEGAGQFAECLECHEPGLYLPIADRGGPYRVRCRACQQRTTVFIVDGTPIAGL